MQPTWVIMPVMIGMEMTRAAISDVLAQSVPTNLLIINQGCPTDMRVELEQIAESDNRVFCFHHDPALPSLSATWNTALGFVWNAGGTEALVINNDVRIRPDTVEWLSKILHLTKALFVSAVGVTREQFDPTDGLIFPTDPDADQPVLNKGGPDFSCFLISKECHAKYRFDEACIPAFVEDNMYHREMMLGGDGARIFSVNLPFHHLSSQTLKQVDPAKRVRINQAIERGSRAHYRKSWGGGVNQERYTRKGDSSSARDGVTNPELQRCVQSGRPITDLIPA